MHGVDYIKIYTTQDFAGTVHMWKPDGTLVNSPSLTLEEVEAIVDEAHRLGLKVACHTYGGEGLMSCLTAGVDAPNHLLELDDAGVKILLQKKLPFVPTVDDLISLEQADLRDTGGRNSRLRLLEQAVRRAVAAGVPIVFGSGATSERIPHGKQADQFKYYAKWGMSPVQALQTAYLPCCTDAELRLGKPDRRNRKRQVCGHHRGLWKSHCGRDRNGTSQVCNEGRRNYTKRSRFRCGVAHTLGLSASLNAIDLEGSLWFKGGCSEDAGRSSAAVSIPDHLLRRGTPRLR